MRVRDCALPARCPLQIRIRIGAEDSLNYRISGILYCVAPLAELSGSSSISFTDIRITSQLSWEVPE